MRTLLCSVVVAAGCLFGQSSSSTPNPQDVPKQQPGTNNPDVSKERNGPSGKPGKSHSDTNSADVPVQQPGTNSPDVAKDHRDSTGNTNASGKTTGSRTKAKRKSTATS